MVKRSRRPRPRPDRYGSVTVFVQSGDWRADSTDFPGMVGRRFRPTSPAAASSRYPSQSCAGLQSARRRRCHTRVCRTGEAWFHGPTQRVTGQSFRADRGAGPLATTT